MSYQKPPVDSRNIYTTGVVQQACAAGTIKSTSDLLEWTKIATMAYDRYMNTNSMVVKEAAFGIIHAHLNGLTHIGQLKGDPTANIMPFHEKFSDQLQVFMDNQTLANLYNQIYFLTRERQLK